MTDERDDQNKKKCEQLYLSYVICLSSTNDAASSSNKAEYYSCIHWMTPWLSSWQANVSPSKQRLQVIETLLHATPSFSSRRAYPLLTMQTKTSCHRQSASLDCQHLYLQYRQTLIVSSLAVAKFSPRRYFLQ